MSVKSEMYYSLTCDWEGCSATSPDDSEEMAAWQDVSTAIEQAFGKGWQRIDGKDHCPEHWHNPSEELAEILGSDDPLPGPAPEEVSPDLAGDQSPVDHLQRMWDAFGREQPMDISDPDLRAVMWGSLEQWARDSDAQARRAFAEHQSHLAEVETLRDQVNGAMSAVSLYQREKEAALAKLQEVRDVLAPEWIRGRLTTRMVGADDRERVRALREIIEKDGETDE